QDASRRGPRLRSQDALSKARAIRFGGERASRAEDIARHTARAGLGLAHGLSGLGRHRARVFAFTGYASTIGRPRALDRGCRNWYNPKPGGSAMTVFQNGISIADLSERARK